MPANFKLLIVEDDDDTRTNMEDVLSLDHYQIKTLGHCQAAIAAIESENFDAVIVDWQLPDGNGGDLVPVIKKLLIDSPVIVITGFREFDTAVKALRTGAYDFLTKPINPDALRSLIRRLVERKSHLAKIASTQQRLLANERLAAIGQMVTGLAHESRNAFQRSHACLAELSLDLNDIPDSLNLVRKVQKSLDDLNFLLEEVREYAAPINLKRQPCNLESLVKETWQNILDARQIESIPGFRVLVGAESPDSYNADRSRMGQVIRNLLENATVASSGQNNILVEIQLEQATDNSDDCLQLSISDDGAGVPEANREQVFAPFFTTKTKGTGLGLAICRRIIDAHDGKLYVTDAKLGGARFVIELPPATVSIGQLGDDKNK